MSSSRVLMSDLDNGVYIPVGGTIERNAIAAENSHVWISPALDVELQIDKLWITFGATDPAGEFVMRIANAASVATITGNRAGSNLLDLASPAAPKNAKSRLERGSKAGFVGTQFFKACVNTAITVPIDFGRTPLILYGNDPEGIPALVISHGTVNSLIRVSVQARERALNVRLK